MRYEINGIVGWGRSRGKLEVHAEEMSRETQDIPSMYTSPEALALITIGSVESINSRGSKMKSR
ncbi:hypothetical protein [Haloquadratum walsbyi]|uniref:Uncharacterized protein n=1 Tax=Haloquadratum walsbyi (strain DSM 16854 / JCM 12705 / C23) TaxID=768065 RepID=G0LNA1_HALWC|nr:hypothetical protein [Haloquadratum walsbyi]CCC41907.1 uncharacterized protein Hqrw_5031 [Haloquadratum walsbyi C23]